MYHTDHTYHDVRKPEPFKPTEPPCVSLFFRVVKEEISDDSAKLPCFNGRVVSWVRDDKLAVYFLFKAGVEAIQISLLTFLFPSFPLEACLKMSRLNFNLKNKPTSCLARGCLQKPPLLSPVSSFRPPSDQQSCLTSSSKIK